MLSSWATLVPAAAAAAASAGIDPTADPSLQTRGAATWVVVANNTAAAGTEVLTAAVPTPAETTSAVLTAVV